MAWMEDRMVSRIPPRSPALVHSRVVRASVVLGCGLQGIVALVHLDRPQLLQLRPVACSWALEKEQLFWWFFGGMLGFSIKDLHFPELHIGNGQ